MKPCLPLPPDVLERLLAEKSAAYDQLAALIHERDDEGFTREQEMAVGVIIRRIACIDGVQRPRGLHAATPEELAWLQEQGVPLTPESSEDGA